MNRHVLAAQIYLKLIRTPLSEGEAKGLADKAYKLADDFYAIEMEQTIRPNAIYDGRQIRIDSFVDKVQENRFYIFPKTLGVARSDIIRLLDTCIIQEEQSDDSSGIDQPADGNTPPLGG